MKKDVCKRHCSFIYIYSILSNVAKDLDHGDNIESRQKWAKAILDDAQSQLALEQQNYEYKEQKDILDSIQVESQLTAAKVMSELTEHDLINAMTVARSILLDVEDSLRSISQDDAEEIADVGIAVAKIFLWGLQDVHRHITPNMIVGDEASHDLDVEYLDEEGAKANDDTNNDKGKRKKERMRCIWPPIGPAVGSLASWGKDEALKKPILSIALAMTLWPAVLIGAFLGGPIIAADWCLQKSYEALKDKPILEAAEISAANVYQVGKFYFLISKLFVKQSIRFGKRQIKRRGGVEQIVRDVGDWTVDRTLHPIESAGMLWNSAIWTGGKVVEGVKFAKDVVVSNGDAAKEKAVREGLL